MARRRYVGRSDAPTLCSTEPGGASPRRSRPGPVAAPRPRAPRPGSFPGQGVRAVDRRGDAPAVHTGVVLEVTRGVQLPGVADGGAAVARNGEQQALRHRFGIKLSFCNTRRMADDATLIDPLLDRAHDRLGVGRTGVEPVVQKTEQRYSRRMVIGRITDSEQLPVIGASSTRQRLQCGGDGLTAGDVRARALRRGGAGGPHRPARNHHRLRPAGSPCRHTHTSLWRR